MNTTRYLPGWFWTVLDYFFIPVVIIFVIYQPNFMHGFIDFLEGGNDLACVNEIFHGGVPYRDMFILFGPLNIYLNVFFMLLFGKTLAVASAYFYYGAILTLIIGYLLSRNLCRGRFFSYAAAFFLMVETFHPFWVTRWPEIRFGAGLLVLLCVVQIFKHTRKQNVWVILTGMCAGGALLISLDVGVFSLIAVASTLCFHSAYILWQEKKVDLKNVSFFIIGAFLSILPLVIYFIAVGAFLPYVNTVLALIRDFIKVWSQPVLELNLWRIIRPERILRYEFKYILPVLVYLIAGIRVIIRAVGKKLTWREYGMMVITIYGLLMYKSAFRAMLGPQFQMALQPAIVLGFILIEDIFNEAYGEIKKKRAGGGNFTKLIVCAVIFVGSMTYAVYSEKRFYGDIKGWFLYQKYKKHIMPTYTGAVPFSGLKMKAVAIDRAKGTIVLDEQAKVIEGVTEYIKKVTEPKESVFTFPEHGMYNFLTNRPCLDRFNIAGYAWTKSEWREELLRDLNEKKPRYIIYGKNLSNLAKAIQRTKEVLPEVIEYIEGNYEKEKTFGTTDILRRKNR
ncbi:MAG: hypothetical protein ABH844_05170 [Candidatus Omnitrophota bacterium]